MSMMTWLMGLKSITPAELHERVQTPGQVSVFDVNSPQSFRTARVPGARNLDPAAYTAGELPAGQSDALVFYCSNPMCRKAPNAARRAKAMGYTNVEVMSAGITGWVAAKLPTESGA
jgi:rhodanese-related sulfurtransferase